MNQTPLQKSPLGPQKVKNTPKTKSNSKVTIEESIENESCATILVDRKTFFELKPTPKKASKGPKKAQNDPKPKIRRQKILQNKNYQLI